MNEKQLGVGETTISGRKELVNPEGMFMIEELQKIVLQRCTNARQAITLIGELAEKYGYGDWGECLTFADPQEASISQYLPHQHAVKEKGSEKTDTIISPMANPWMMRDEMAMLNGIRKDVVPNNRNIAVPQCAYSTVIQLRSWLPDAVGGVAYFAFDNPGQSPRIPIFCGVNDLPTSFKVCGQHRYHEDAAVWTYRRANKLATVKWGATRKVMEKNLSYFDSKGERELAFVESQYAEILKSQGKEAAQAFLTGYTADYAGATLLRWQEMGDQFWHDFQKGF